MKNRISLAAILLAFTFLIPILPAKSDSDCGSICDSKVYISKSKLNFNRCTIDTIPPIYMLVERWRDEGNIEASIKSTIPWLIIEQVKDEPDEKAFIFSVDPKKVTLGLYNDNIMVITNVGNYTIPVRLDLVEKKVNIKIFVGQQVVLIDNQEHPITEPAFIKDEWPWIPLQIVVETIGGTIDYEKDSANRIVAVNVHYKDINQKLLVCGSILIRKNQAFVYWGSLWSVFQCKISYELSQNMVEIEY
jgi:hypothetical protein